MRICNLCNGLGSINPRVFCEDLPDTRTECPRCCGEGVEHNVPFELEELNFDLPEVTG